MARATRADVAALAGVAPTTVSNILNGRAPGLRIAQTTVDRVLAAASALNYVPQASARRLRGRVSRTLGLLLGPLPTAVFVPVLHDVVTAAIAEAQARNHLVLPFADPGGEPTDLGFVDRVLADVDLAGLVSELTPRNALAGERLHHLDVPVVWMSLRSPMDRPAGIGHAAIIQSPGMEAMLSRLDLARGEEVAILLGPQHRPERLTVAERVFAGRCHVIETKSWLVDAGTDGFRRVRRELPRVSTIVCLDDYLAYGVLDGAAADGLRVPEDYSVVGFGGFDTGAPASRRLTTVRWPVRDLTRTAVDTLIDHLTGAKVLQRLPQAPIIAELQCEPVFGQTARLKDRA